jgi:hypothetical protein
MRSAASGSAAVRLQKLTAQMLNALYVELEASGRRNGKGLSPRSVRHVHAIMPRALADAVAWNLVLRNVAEAAQASPQGAAKDHDVERRATAKVPGQRPG